MVPAEKTFQNWRAWRDGECPYISVAGQCIAGETTLNHSGGHIQYTDLYDGVKTPAAALTWLNPRNAKTEGMEDGRTRVCFPVSFVFDNEAAKRYLACTEIHNSMFWINKPEEQAGILRSLSNCQKAIVEITQKGMADAELKDCFEFYVADFASDHAWLTNEFLKYRNAIKAH